MIAHAIILPIAGNLNAIQISPIENKSTHGKALLLVY